ncbi:hypothetical protein BOX15_Mlig011144g1, partial [Macrostomum lignano]
QYYELFSAQGRGPAENWKVSGSSIRKVFDKELHTYVYSLEGSPSTCKMTLPSDKRKPCKFSPKLTQEKQFYSYGYFVLTDLL